MYKGLNSRYKAQLNSKKSERFAQKSQCLFFHFPYSEGGEQMSPINLFKAGVMFGLTIYALAKKGFISEKLRD